MTDRQDPIIPDDCQALAGTRSERRSRRDRRRNRIAGPPPGQEERRHSVRRRADRLYLEGTVRTGEHGPGGRVFRRVRIQVPIICKRLGSGSSPGDPPLRGLTHTLAAGGLGMLLEEDCRVGTPVEVLVRFEGDLLSADVQVVSVIHQGTKLLHNCRFTRLGTADRTWLTEYLRIRDAPSA